MCNIDIMRKFVLLLMAVLSVSLTGCDFVRKIAGRPTGRDIEDKRVAIIRAENEALQSRLDSIRLAEEKIIADSLAVLDFFEVSGVMMSGPERLGGLAGTELDYDYYIIVGAFRESANARKLFKTASVSGYSPVLISCRNGMTAVGLCPTNGIHSIKEAYDRVSGEPFCPKNAWILVKE